MLSAPTLSGSAPWATSQLTWCALPAATARQTELDWVGAEVVPSSLLAGGAGCCSDQPHRYKRGEDRQQALGSPRTTVSDGSNMAGTNNTRRGPRARV